MIKYYIHENGKLVESASHQTGCWISCVNPLENEIEFLVNDLGFEHDFIRAALDSEESSRVEKENDQVLIVVDYPTMNKDEHGENTVQYTTMPMAFIVQKTSILTVSLEENSVISDLVENRVRGMIPEYKTQFLLKVLLHIAKRFLLYLRQIDRIAMSTESSLHQSMRNKELFQLLGLEKSLVYLSTSLKSNEATITKLSRGRLVKLYDEDVDLLEDVLIEIRQAIEMSGIYATILSSTMDAFAAIISNNLNIVMKILTSLTIVMAVPNIVFGFYGMNVIELPFDQFWWMPIILTGIFCLIVAWILYTRNLFK